MAQHQASRRNAVRFDLLEDLQMDRLQFSRLILQKELGIATNHLEYIFAYPGKKIFEVIFTTFLHFEDCIKRYQAKRTAPGLNKISMTPLGERDLKTVHVMIFSEKVKNQDVMTWMNRHCDVINGTELMDIDGIKTGTRRFQVKLRRREGDLVHIPDTIQLGVYRGSVFYPGQPKECRKCGSLTHLAAACTSDNCRICKSADHRSKDCPTPVKCNLCNSTNHRFIDCPEAYANKVKLSNSTVTLTAAMTANTGGPSNNSPNLNPGGQPVVRPKVCPTTATGEEEEADERTKSSVACAKEVSGAEESMDTATTKAMEALAALTAASLHPRASPPATTSASLRGSPSIPPGQTVANNSGRASSEEEEGGLGDDEQEEEQEGDQEEEQEDDRESAKEGESHRRLSGFPQLIRGPLSNSQLPSFQPMRTGHTKSPSRASWGRGRGRGKKPLDIASPRKQVLPSPRKRVLTSPEAAPTEYKQVRPHYHSDTPFLDPRSVDNFRLATQIGESSMNLPSHLPPGKGNVNRDKKKVKPDQL